MFCVHRDVLSIVFLISVQISYGFTYGVIQHYHPLSTPVIQNCHPLPSYSEELASFTYCIDSNNLALPTFTYSCNSALPPFQCYFSTTDCYLYFSCSLKVNVLIMGLLHVKMFYIIVHRFPAINNNIRPRTKLYRSISPLYTKRGPILIISFVIFL